jgi:pyruvate ferredoxin oxidoreductase alpha subunit
LHEQSAALNQSAVIIKKTAELFWQKFRRKFGFYETYMADDAEYLLITTGVNTINSRRVITTLRTQGNKIGLIKLKILRPFPDELQKFIGGKNVAVLDVNIQQGLSGTVYNEMRLIDNKLGLNFILQNRVLREKDFEEIFKKLTSRTGGIYWL